MKTKINSLLALLPRGERLVEDGGKKIQVHLGSATPPESGRILSGSGVLDGGVVRRGGGGVTGRDEETRGEGQPWVEFECYVQGKGLEEMWVPGTKTN